MIDSSPAMIGWERSMMAAEKVKDRLRRAAALLDQAGVPYAVVGGNAVASWVGRIDEGAVRNTRDVDILIRRTDLDAAKLAMQSGGFIHSQTLGVEMFLDGPDSRTSEAVHLLFAGEKVEAKHITVAPDVSECERTHGLQVIALEALVRMKLNSNRDKDRTHLRDMIGVGLVDESWVGRFPAELAARLQHLFDTPGG